MHNHGYEYRAKMTDDSDQVEYSEWFNTRDALTDAMRRIVRDPKKQYSCETRMARCADEHCDADQTPRAMSTL